jgi:hypothetical protein
MEWVMRWSGWGLKGGSGAPSRRSGSVAVEFFAWSLGTCCVEFLSVFNGESNYGTTANQVPVQFEPQTHQLTVAA